MISKTNHKTSNKDKTQSQATNPQYSNNKTTTYNSQKISTKT